MTSAQVTADAGPAARVSAILFDLDGVLVDSLRVVERAWRRWAREHGLPADEVLAVVHGRIAREVIGMFTPHLDAAEQAVLVGGYETQHGASWRCCPAPASASGSPARGAGRWSPRGRGRSPPPGWRRSGCRCRRSSSPPTT